MSENFGFSASSGFALLGVLSLIANFILVGRLSALFFPFFAKKILKRFRKIHLISALPHPSTIILLQSNSWLDAILLYSHIPNLKILVPGRSFRKFPLVNGLVDSIRLVPHELDDKGVEKLSLEIQNCRNKEKPICLFMHREGDPNVVESYEHALNSLQIEFVKARIQKDKISKSILGIRFAQKQINLKL